MWVCRRSIGSALPDRHFAVIQAPRSSGSRIRKWEIFASRLLFMNLRGDLTYELFSGNVTQQPIGHYVHFVASGAAVRLFIWGFALGIKSISLSGTLLLSRILPFFFLSFLSFLSFFLFYFGWHFHCLCLYEWERNFVGKNWVFWDLDFNIHGSSRDNGIDIWISMKFHQ